MHVLGVCGRRCAATAAAEEALAAARQAKSGRGAARQALEVAFHGSDGQVSS